MEIVIGVSGASGVVYAIKLLEALKQQNHIVTHLILSDYAKKNILIETDYQIEEVMDLATYVHENHNLAAGIASGSYKVDATIILPCSMKTLGSVSIGLADNLITRVCDVALKEGKKLVICPRETPLNAIHLENMLKLSRLGVAIIPPIPGFYGKPQSIDEIINHHIMKVLDHIGVNYESSKRWGRKEGGC